MKSLNSYIIENIIPVDESVKELYDDFVAAVNQFDAKYPFYGDKWKPETVKEFFCALPKLTNTEELIKHIGGWVIARKDWGDWKKQIENNLLNNKYNAYLGKVSESDLKHVEWYVIKYKDRSDSCKIASPCLIYCDDKNLFKAVFDYLKTVHKVATPKKTSDYDADYKKYLQEIENKRPQVWE